MALADILLDIEREADAEVERIRAEAERESEELIGAARAAADLDASELSEARHAELQDERHGLLARAASEATATLRDAREEVIARVLARVREHLADLRAEPSYPSLLRALAGEALEALPEASTILVDRRDADAMRAVVNEADPSGERDLRVESSLETWGGVEVATSDGRLVRNTLEERLERATTYLRPLIASIVPGLAPDDGLEATPC